MNRSTFRLMPYISRVKTRADGTTAVLLRITIDGKKTVVTTDFSCRQLIQIMTKVAELTNEYRAKMSK